MSDVEKKKTVRGVKVGGGEVILVSKDRFANSREAAIMSCTHTEMKGRVATSLIERWGLVAGKPDGEDSSGRTSLRLLSPDEIVDRACQTADLAVEEFRRRGWIHEIPEHLLLGDSEEE